MRWLLIPSLLSILSLLFLFTLLTIDLNTQITLHTKDIVSINDLKDICAHTQQYTELSTYICNKLKTKQITDNESLNKALQSYIKSHHFIDINKDMGLINIAFISALILYIIYVISIILNSSMNPIYMIGYVIFNTLIGYLLFSLIGFYLNYLSFLFTLLFSLIPPIIMWIFIKLR